MVGTRASLKKKKSVLSQSLWLSSGSFSRASRVSISRTKTACGDGVCGPHRLDRERQMAFLGFLFRSSKNQRAVVKRPRQFLFIKDYTTASWLATATPQTVYTNSWDCSITAPRSWPAIVHADYNSTNFASTGITRRLRRPPWKTIDCLLLLLLLLWPSTQFRCDDTCHRNNTRLTSMFLSLHRQIPSTIYNDNKKKNVEK